FFSPLLSVVTSAVTACAMVIVGVMMTKSLGKIEWDVWPVAFSAFITIIFMILTYSISNGIGFGFIAYVVAMLCSKKAKEIHWMMYVVSGLFVVYYILTTLFL
ncbi:MAG: NCS2 family permease, partial [Bacilli bacterium]